MSRIVDRVFGFLLILATCGHITGTFMFTEHMSQLFVWSLGAAIGTGVLGVLNVVRAGRPQDKTLAAITAVGTACVALMAFGFGVSIGNLLDPRPLGFMIICAVLVIFSVATLRGAAAHS